MNGEQATRKSSAEKWRMSNRQVLKVNLWYLAFASAIVESHAPERSKSHIPCKSCLVSSSAAGYGNPRLARGPILTCSRNLLPVQPSEDSERQRKRISPLHWLASFSILRKAAQQQQKRHQYEMASQPPSLRNFRAMISVLFPRG